MPSPMTSRVWYRAVLSADQVAAGHVNRISKLFAEALGAAGDPAGACLFVTSPDAQSDMVFFSPAAVSSVPHLIAEYGAEPSGPPEREVAELLVGQDRDWKLLARTTH